MIITVLSFALAVAVTAGMGFYAHWHIKTLNEGIKPRKKLFINSAGDVKEV